MLVVMSLISDRDLCLAVFSTTDIEHAVLLGRCYADDAIRLDAT